jgi:glycosyltransferase involved in cell wall biosynthesis
MEQLKFLILLFYYDRPEMVKNALRSINKSTYTNFTIAFIDDGSTTPGKPIVEETLSPDLLSKVIFYNTNHSIADKIKQGGSIFGKLANEALQTTKCDIALMLCDDDALTPGYLEYLNEYFKLNSEVNHCYSKVLFYNPTKEDYTQSKETINFNHSGTTYNLNHYDTPINPYCKVDSSQVAWRVKCNLENNIWFPYPQTRNLDASLYKQLYEKCGECYPTFTFGQCKGAFEDQLGNRYNSTNNEYQVYAS